MLVVLSPTFISTDQFYYGKIKPLATTRSEFTATEERIIEIISNGLNETLEVAWRDLMK